jgi:anti-anti-sigma regulatory factor
LIVDISDVEQTDTASLQAFCALQKILVLNGQ